ncbi:hypothetical protein FACS1894137_13020 [Spirochaetia bacterium]|nr:hypothetical protein FACS1894137_13020 [Spirochaetia bacterium]
MKKLTAGLLTGLAALFFLLLGSCALGGEDAGNVTIRVGDGESVDGRAALSPELIAQFRYEFSFTGPGQSFTRDLPAGVGALILSLDPGTWTIAATAYTAADTPAGSGSATVTINRGSNSVRIPMARALYLVINSGSESAFTIPTNTARAYDWTIDWGDGAAETRTGTGALDTGIAHSFPAANTDYTVSISASGEGGHAAFGFSVDLNNFDIETPVFPSGVNSAANRNKVQKALGHIQESSGGGDTWDYTFFFCTNLVEISPDLLPAISNVGTDDPIFSGMFTGCAALSALPGGFQIPALPPGTDYDYALSGMFNFSGLETVNLPTAAHIGGSMFAFCFNLSTISLPEALTIGSDAFAGCLLLSAVNLPKLTTIGSNAFGQCRSLARVDLPMVTTIDDRAFQGAGCTRVELPQLTTLGSNVFSQCRSLTRVDIPVVTTIGEVAFYECTGLSTITLGASPPTVGKDLFDGISLSQTITIRVPNGSMGAYVTTSFLQVAFKGRGSDNTGTANAYITLTPLGY